MNMRVEAEIQNMTRENRVLDVGSSTRFHKTLKKYANMFGPQYTTLDKDENVKPDIVGDVQMLRIGDEQVDGILCLSVLEHVENPVLAVQEMRRVLKPGKKAIFYVPTYHPYHANMKCKDYYRFYHDALRFLFDDWSSFETFKHGNPLAVLCRFLPGRIRFFDKFKTSTSMVLGYYVVAVK